MKNFNAYLKITILMTMAATVLPVAAHEGPHHSSTALWHALTSFDHGALLTVAGLLLAIFLWRRKRSQVRQ